MECEFAHSYLRQPTASIKLYIQVEENKLMNTIKAFIKFKI